MHYRVEMNLQKENVYFSLPNTCMKKTLLAPDIIICPSKIVKITVCTHFLQKYNFFSIRYILAEAVSSYQKAKSQVIIRVSSLCTSHLSSNCFNTFFVDFHLNKRFFFFFDEEESKFC